MAFFSDINVINTNVKGSLAKTKFGDFFAPWSPRWGTFEIVFGLSMCTSILTEAAMVPQQPCQGASAARVEKSRFLGHESLIEFTEDDGSRLVATMPHIFLPEKDVGFGSLYHEINVRCFLPKTRALDQN